MSTERPLGQRKIGYVFQAYRECAFFPGFRPSSNIEYPLMLEGVPLGERRRRSNDTHRHLERDVDLNRYPYELSAGQQQLISICVR